MSGSIHSDLPDTVRIGARRFEQSPYYERYANSETILGVAAGRYYAAFNGEDPVETYWTLRRNAVLFDVPEKPWQIEGPDVLPFLERIFARRIGNLPQGRGRYVIACTPDGGIFMDGILFKLAEKCYWYVQPGDWAGKSLLMKTQQGELVSCEIVALPFYDANKRIPRGLEKPVV